MIKRTSFKTYNTFFDIKFPSPIDKIAINHQSGVPVLQQSNHRPCYLHRKIHITNRSLLHHLRPPEHNILRPHWRTSPTV